MPSGLPARGALVCTLMFGVAIAHADRRSVAVIDMSADQKTIDLARDLNPILLGHETLQPLLDPKLAAELYGSFRDDDNATAKDAEFNLTTAEEQLSRYSFDVVFESSKGGQDKLRGIVPDTPGAVRLYAKLAFVNGQALLGIPRRASEAPRSFALASRLDPSFVPDAARYLPDVIQAFDAAKRRWTGKGTVTIAGSGRLWVDGVAKGAAPAELELEAGPHVVWLTGDERLTDGREIVVEADQKLKVEFPPAPADILVKVRRARAALRNAQDPAARAAAMKKLAQLLSRDKPVRDAVLLQVANGKIIFQTWNAGTRAHAPGFSAYREYANMNPSDLLTSLAPPKEAEEPKPVTFDKPVIDDRRWYERPTWQTTMVVGAVAVLIGGYYIYKGLTDDDFVIDDQVDITSRRSPLGVSW